MESSFAGWCNYKTKSQIWSPFLTQSIYQPFHLTPSHSIHQPFHLTPNQLTLTSKSPPLTINESHIDPSQSPSTPWLTSLPHPTPGPASLFFNTLAHLTSHTTTCPTSLLLPWSISLPHATPYPPHCHSTRWPTSFSLSNLAHLTSTYHTLIRLTLLQRPKPLHFHIPHPDPPQSLSTPWPTSLPCATPWSNFLSIPDQSLFIQRPYSPRFRSTTHERGELLVYFPIQESAEGILCLPGSIITQIGRTPARWLPWKRHSWLLIQNLLRPEALP